MDGKKKCPDCGVEMELKEIKFLGTTRQWWVTKCDCFDKARIREEIHEIIGASNIPKKYLGVSLKDWIKVPGTEPMFSVLEDYAKNIEQNIKNGSGLLFQGNTGTGKTMLGCWLLQYIVKKLRKRVYYISGAELSYKLSQEKGYNLDAFVSKLSTVRVLLFDDYGESEIDSWKKKLNTKIIDERLNNRRTTLFTTMLSAEELSEAFGPHIVSRIMEMVGKNIGVCRSIVDMREPKNKEKYLQEQK